MAELTKEFFEQAIKSLATKDDLVAAFEKQQEFIDERFNEIQADLDLPARLRAIEKRLDKLDKIETQRAHS